MKTESRALSEQWLFYLICNELMLFAALRQ